MILTRSGGLVYHTRAALYRKLWSPTRQFITAKLRQWIVTHFREPGRTLFIFGPSAAYLLDFSVFNELPQRTKIVVIDPDKIAKQIFLLRWRSLEKLKFNSDISIEWWLNSDLLPFSSFKENTFSEFINGEANGSVLFFGLLGQIEFHFKTRPADIARSLLLKALENKTWMSLHDVASCQTDKSSETSFLAVQRALAESSGLVGDLAQTLLSVDKAIATTETNWIDHDTEWLRKHSSAERVPWFLTPHRLHILEVVGT